MLLQVKMHPNDDNIFWTSDVRGNISAFDRRMPKGAEHVPNDCIVYALSINSEGVPRRHTPNTRPCVHPRTPLCMDGDVNCHPPPPPP